MKTITAANKLYKVYWTTGMVAGSGKNMETIVRGSGGGGGVYNGYGGSAPVTITSATVVHDQIFLVDKTGQEHAFQLQGFNVACRESNQLSVIWAIPNGKQSGPYIIAYNHTTGNAFYNDAVLTRIFRYAAWYLLAAIAVCLVLGQVSSIFYVLALAAPFVWQWLAKQQARKFKAAINFADFV